MYTLDIFDEKGKLLRKLEATEEQTAIIDYALGNKQSLLINALAGAAKTSTLRFLCKYLPPDQTLSLAFNKRIADEMAKVLPGHVRAATMNSVGHRVWAATCGKRLTVETKKSYNLVKEYVDALPRQRRTEAYESFGDITKTISLAKLSGYVPPGIPSGKSLISSSDFYGDLEEAPESWFCEAVDKVLAKAVQQSYGGLIDFDDQIYMSTLFGGAFPSFPRVMVDEAQDLSPLNHAMLNRLVGSTTHLTAVGDPWQSIYAFRGAVTSSMALLRQRFAMHEMTLSVSFRCPQRIVERARSRVPHMKWPSWAAEGHVETLAEWNSDDIPDGSAIICRNNAPLFSCALALLRSGRGVHLVGTDLGPNLTRTLKKLGDLQMPQDKVHEAINEWERDKLRKARDGATVADKAECLRVFASFGPNLGAAIAYAGHLFESKGPIQLLSGHKAKGLEWDTVYHLDPHRIPSPWAREGEALEQELNVRYVIETRAKQALYLVNLQDLNGENHGLQ